MHSTKAVRDFHSKTSDGSMTSYELSEEEVAIALEEAKARGLPDGWTVKLDVSADDFLCRICRLCNFLCWFSPAHRSVRSTLHVTKTFINRKGKEENGSLLLVEPVIPFQRL